MNGVCEWHRRRHNTLCSFVAYFSTCSWDLAPRTIGDLGFSGGWCVCSTSCGKTQRGTSQHRRAHRWAVQYGPEHWQWKWERTWSDTCVSVRERDQWMDNVGGHSSVQERTRVYYIYVCVHTFLPLTTGLVREAPSTFRIYSCSLNYGEQLITVEWKDEKKGCVPPIHWQ